MDMIKANMDTKQTRYKPDKDSYEFIAIRSRLKCNIECMSIEEFIHRVGERYTAYGIALLDGMHTATPSGRFCGRKWTRSGASGQFS